MSAKEIDTKDVPGIEVVWARLAAIDSGLGLDRVGYDSEKMAYILVLTGQGREGRATISRELLEDIRDNRTSPASRYTQELHAKLSDRLREVIESHGLISFSETALKFKLLQFIFIQCKTQLHVEKYNTIGRDGQGDFERWLGASLAEDEKETLIWIWGDLIRLRLITPTGKDLVTPDTWVRITDKGLAAIEGKSYIEYDEREVFIPKGEVFTAYRTIRDIVLQGRAEILVIDPYVDEDLLDMFAGVDPSVKIRVPTEHLKGGFKLAYRKLLQQRGSIEVRCSTQFHDRFIVLDGQACYQLGGSINHAGAKATTIGRKSDVMRDKILTEAEKAWVSANPVS